MRLVIALLALGLLWPQVSSAVQPDEILPNAALEQRARQISSGLRCLVCQNQSIDDSDAPLARDLRILVRERLVAGDSYTAVTDFVVARYGNFVLLRPPLNLETLALWASPFLLLVLGLAFLWRRSRAMPVVLGNAKPLSDDEQARLEKLTVNEPN